MINFNEISDEAISAFLEGNVTAEEAKQIEILTGQNPEIEEVINVVSDAIAIIPNPDSDSFHDTYSEYGDTGFFTDSDTEISDCCSIDITDIFENLDFNNHNFDTDNSPFNNYDIETDSQSFNSDF